MARQQTKKNYSLRKLKTGTASVAVALTVLGAGFANQTEVRAEGVKATKNLSEEAKYAALRDENTGLRGDQTKLVKNLKKNKRRAKI
ncbi:hypothetical protein STAB901_08360 [Streptococcus pyogenes STAB901]|nr:hypothetical protein STAB901_08360 [Streptococcus pyogenes STAB901]